MSVINQMLKDLEQRNPKQQPDANAALAAKAMVTPEPKRTGLVTILAITLIAITTAASLWRLYQENQTLKQEQQNQQSRVAEFDKAADTNQLATPTTSAVSAEPVQLAAKPAISTAPVIKNQLQAPQKPINADMPDSNQQLAQSKAATNSQRVNNQTVNQPAPTEAVSDKSVQVEETEIVPAKPTAKPVVKVARRQLSAEELVIEKMKQVEQALFQQNANKAETLLAEVLVLKQSNDDARKQLAALWYGRHAYQDAINLLSQGLTLNPSNAEFRLMQARIFIAQNNYQAAFKVLNVLADNSDIDYLTVLANSAQQSHRFKAAAQVYQKLTLLQPEQAKWWLGLAVAYDSDGSFKQAITAYKKSLMSTGLSANASAFAVQRLQQLGG